MKPGFAAPREHAPATIIDVKPVLEAGEEYESTPPDAASGEGERPSWRD